MTRDTSTSTRAERIHDSALAFGLLALVLLCGAAATGTVMAQDDRPTVRVADATAAPNGTTTADVVLTNAPNGLAGYYLEISVENADVARIQSANYPSEFGLTSDPVIGSENRTVHLEAADMEGSIEPGASGVTLATVQLVGATPGSVDVSVEPKQFDSDEGETMQLATQPGRLTVTGADGEAGVGTATDAPNDAGAVSQNATPGETVSNADLGLLSIGLAFVTVCALAVISRYRGDA